MNDGIKSRKLWMTLGFQLLWCIMFQWGDLDQTGLLTLTQWTLGGYFVANVWEKRQ